VQPGRSVVEGQVRSSRTSRILRATCPSSRTSLCGCTSSTCLMTVISSRCCGCGAQPSAPSPTDRGVDESLFLPAVHGPRTSHRPVVASALGTFGRQARSCHLEGVIKGACREKDSRNVRNDHTFRGHQACHTATRRSCRLPQKPTITTFLTKCTQRVHIRPWRGAACEREQSLSRRTTVRMRVDRSHGPRGVPMATAACARPHHYAYDIKQKYAAEEIIRRTSL
jgi:hypothetical protein